MKTHTRPRALRRSLSLLCLLATVSPAASFGAPANPRIYQPDAATVAFVAAAVRAADDERVVATKSGDRARLEMIYSDDLHYAHSSAKVDNKASYVDSLVKRTTVYEKYDYEKRDFQLVAPGIVLMTGRASIEAGAPGKAQKNYLSYLAVWRQENGQWRFLAWQSCKVPTESMAPTEVRVQRQN